MTRPILFRCRSTDLSGAVVAGTHIKPSVAWGDREILSLVGIERFDHLAVSKDGGPVVEVLLRRPLERPNQMQMARP